MKFLLYTIINTLSILFARQFISPVVLFLLFYILLYFQCKRENPLQPVFWLFVIWNVLIINSFSNIIYFIAPSDFEYFVAYILSILSAFFVGYEVTLKKKYVREARISLDFFQTRKAMLLSKVFCIMSIIAVFLNVFDVVFINGLNIFNPFELRNYVNNKTSASVFSQFSSILYFGGLISIFLFFLSKKNRMYNFISIFCYMLGSILSAGRQQLFQVFLLFGVFVVINRGYRLKFKLYRTEKIAVLGMFVILILYLGLIANKRNFEADNVDSDFICNFYETSNNIQFCEDYKSFISFLPTAIQGPVVEMTFYFSHQLYAFMERTQNLDYDFIQFKYLRFIPFIERQVDKIHIFGGESQYDRFQKNQNSSSYSGNIISTAWATIINSSLLSFGYIGIYILVFLHGIIAAKIYMWYQDSLNPYLLLANFANILYLLYTIMFNLLAETSFLFFVLFLLFNLYKVDVSKSKCGHSCFQWHK